MEDEILFAKIKALLAKERFAVLATRGAGYPYCNLIGYAEAADCGRIVFATVRDTRKYGNIKADGAVSLLVDSRTNEVEDLREAQALTALGSAEETAKDDDSSVLELYLSKHPYLEEFVRSPNCALVTVSVDRYIFVSNFQNVMEYRVR